MHFMHRFTFQRSARVSRPRRIGFRLSALPEQALNGVFSTLLLRFLPNCQRTRLPRPLGDGQDDGFILPPSSVALFCHPDTRAQAQNATLQILYHLYTNPEALPNKSRHSLTCWATSDSAHKLHLVL